MTQPDPNSPPNDAAQQTRVKGLIDAIPHIAGSLTRFSTGELARLRRGPLRIHEAGAPSFWKLSLDPKHRFPANDNWAAIIQAMALLTKRTNDGKATSDGRTHESPHKTDYSLGRALCDGGNPAWPEQGHSARPALSELRLARLLHAKGDIQRDLLLRAIRMIARTGTPINCTDIAWFLTARNNEITIRKIARDYYLRLSKAERHA